MAFVLKTVIESRPRRPKPDGRVRIWHKLEEVAEKVVADSKYDHGG